MGLAIVVLAAGLGTRYGGLKQLAPLGPEGEAVLDYTLHDAASAGFSHAVLVVAPETVDATEAHLNEFVPEVAVELVVQPVGGPVRTTPWGTAHATVVGAAGLAVPFAVANADDLYGADALAAIAAYLRSREPGVRANTASLVGYAAGATLSTHGGVSRAVCRVDDEGRLISIEEHTGVRRVTKGITSGIVSDTARLDETTLVSMNLWGFEPSFVDRLQPIVEHFIAQCRQRGDDRELRLPDVVGDLIVRGELEVTVLPTTSAWFGVTYPDDAGAVRKRLAELTAAGAYPTMATARTRRRVGRRGTP
jgi:dTDP-glucose pyrophosphorylase